MNSLSSGDAPPSPLTSPSKGPRPPSDDAPPSPDMSDLDQIWGPSAGQAGEEQGAAADVDLLEQSKQHSAEADKEFKRATDDVPDLDAKSHKPLDVSQYRTAIQEANNSLREDLHSKTHDLHITVLSKLGELSAAFLVEANFDNPAELPTQFRVHADLVSRIVYDDFRAKAAWLRNAADAFAHSLLQVHDQTTDSQMQAYRDSVAMLRKTHKEHTLKIRAAAKLDMEARMRLHRAHMRQLKRKVVLQAQRTVKEARQMARELVKEARVKKCQAERRQGIAERAAANLKMFVNQLTSAMSGKGKEEMTDPTAIMQRYTRKIEDLEDQLADAKNVALQLKNMTASYRDAEERILHMKARLKKQESSHRESQGTSAELESQVAMLKQQLEQAQAQHSTASATSSQQQAEVQELREQLQQLRLDLNTASTRAAQGEAKLTAERQRADGLQENVKELTASVAKLKAAAAAEKKRHRRASQDLDAAASIITDHNARTKKLEKRIRRASISRDFTQLHSDLGEATADISRLEGEKLALRRQVRDLQDELAKVKLVVVEGLQQSTQPARARRGSASLPVVLLDGTGDSLALTAQGHGRDDAGEGSPQQQGAIVSSSGSSFTLQRSASESSTSPRGRPPAPRSSSQRPGSAASRRSSGSRVETMAVAMEVDVPTNRAGTRRRRRSSLVSVSSRAGSVTEGEVLDRVRTEVEAQLRHLIEAEVREKMKEELEAVLRPRLEREVRAEQHEEMKEALRRQAEDLNKGDNELRLEVEQAQGEAHSAKQKASLWKDEAARCRDELGEVRGNMQALDLQVQEKDALLAQLTLLSRAYRHEISTLKQQVGFYQVLVSEDRGGAMMEPQQDVQPRTPGDDVGDLSRSLPMPPLQRSASAKDYLERVSSRQVMAGQVKHPRSISAALNSSAPLQLTSDPAVAAFADDNTCSPTRAQGLNQQRRQSSMQRSSSPLVSPSKRPKSAAPAIRRGPKPHIRSVLRDAHFFGRTPFPGALGSAASHAAAAAAQAEAQQQRANRARAQSAGSTRAGRGSGKTILRVPKRKASAPAAKMRHAASQPALRTAFQPTHQPPQLHASSTAALPASSRMESGRASEGEGSITVGNQAVPLPPRPQLQF